MSAQRADHQEKRAEEPGNPAGDPVVAAMPSPSALQGAGEAAPAGVMPASREPELAPAKREPASANGAAAPKPRARKPAEVTPRQRDEWSDLLKGYDLYLWDFNRHCSRLTLRAVDCIAKRPALEVVFHDVSYIEMPIRIHNARARNPSVTEFARVRKALGDNFRTANVVALCAASGDVYLVEYGFVQCFSAGHEVA